MSHSCLFINCGGFPPFYTVLYNYPEVLDVIVASEVVDVIWTEGFRLEGGFEGRNFSDIKL